MYKHWPSRKDRVSSEADLVHRITGLRYIREFFLCIIIFIYKSLLATTMQRAKLIVHLVKQLHCAHVVLGYQECLYGWVGGFLLRFLGMMFLHLTDTVLHL